MKYQLIHGDCLDVDWPMVDAIITDVPYGTTACKWDVIIPFDKMWAKVKGSLKPRGAFVTTASQPFTSLLIGSNLSMFKYEWIWRKNSPTGFQHAPNRPMMKHENILVFSPSPMGHCSQLGDKRMKYNPQGVRSAGKKTITDKTHGQYLGKRHNQVGRIYNAKTGYPTSDLFFEKEKRYIHPTQKPVALYEYLIKTYTNEGDTILDFCMGSGTTGQACINTGRNFIGIEKDEKYYNIAKERLGL